MMSRCGNATCLNRRERKRAIELDDLPSDLVISIMVYIGPDNNWNTPVDLDSVVALRWTSVHFKALSGTYVRELHADNTVRSDGSKRLPKSGTKL